MQRERERERERERILQSHTAFTAEQRRGKAKLVVMG
jgi:hypothetical protein